MTSLTAIVLGTLLVALALSMIMGPVRLLAGLIAVPIVWAIVSLVAVALWIGLRFRG